LCWLWTDNWLADACDAVAMERTPSTSGALTLIDLVHQHEANKRALSPSFDWPAAKRHDSILDDDDHELSLTLASPGERTCTFSPNFFNQVADDLELSPLLLPKIGESSLPALPPLPAPLPNKQPSRGLSPLSTAETVLSTGSHSGDHLMMPPLTLLEAVQQTRPLATEFSAPPRTRRPATPEASMLHTHAGWQKKLRQALADSDATTRALLSPVASRDLYGTVQLLARLSPRQIDSLHKTARALVESLLEQTRKLVCREAGLTDTGVWDDAGNTLLGERTSISYMGSMSGSHAGSSHAGSSSLKRL